jgi:hypothetical protein
MWLKEIVLEAQILGMGGAILNVIESQNSLLFTLAIFVILIN